jgi:hypothetical protein
VSGQSGYRRPLYARALRLRYIRPGSLMCSALFEGVIGLAVLLSLAELVSWWSILVLPVLVAVLVKVNDIISGAFARNDQTMKFTTRRGANAVRGSARVPSARRRRDSDPDLDSPTEIIPRSRITGRRRSTNQRPFVPANGQGRRKGDW